MEYYKKIDKSTFDGKITIPKKCWAYFINEEDEAWGSHREIKIKNIMVIYVLFYKRETEKFYSSG